ncbi:alpha/beta hydrolase [Paracoccus saliphilus]|uniref:Acetyl esterase/lipase n=1 Tax=Paracoccus saliphilus TaxID=405559 RepID=A0AA45W7E5_9RHOB|nr:alpha/beta hydrolase [Paracoccus saliphilus]WCR02732.1 alpha/beta hydrolase [Paracoccus saliphilus]SIT09103.1 Acetyl esterase/lipase [Paracoccus saliphilus]
MPSTENQDIQGVLIEAQVVPVPSSISIEAQAILRAAVGDDGRPLNALHPSPGPDDHDAWRKMQAVADAHYAEQIKGLAGEVRANVETLKIGTATVHVATPRELRHEDCVYVDLHGGALVFGGGEACRLGAQIQADQHGMVCYAIDYRMPPDHPYPAALDDCILAYRRAIDIYSANRVVIGGRSAGGNLAMATLLRARDEGLPMPAAAVLLSPEVDLTESGESFRTNRLLDVVLPTSLMNTNLLYAGGEDLAHPYLSPLFGELSADFPPTFLQSGTRDLLLSNTVRLHRGLRQAGVSAELHIFEAMPHGGFGGTTPEDIDLKREIIDFVRRQLSPPAGRT